jgi:hypothetical protein
MSHHGKQKVGAMGNEYELKATQDAFGLMFGKNLASELIELA